MNTSVKTNRFKILVADDHAIFREGLLRILNQEKNMTVCGEATDAPTALKMIESLKPDLLITDISMEGMSGIDLIKLVRAKYEALPVLVLSMHKESIYAERALRAGANGYIMKRESGKQLVSAINCVVSGQTHISKDVNENMLQKITKTSHKPGSYYVDLLSDREFEVFRLIGQGYGTRQIAEELSVSMKTVESHREHIRAKLNLKTTFELVQHAINWVHESS